MGGSLLSKAEVPDSSLLGHLPKEFSLRLTWCPWLVGYYGTRGISRGARKLVRTPSLSKKKKNSLDKLTLTMQYKETKFWYSPPKSLAKVLHRDVIGATRPSSVLTQC